LYQFSISCLTLLGWGNDEFLKTKASLKTTADYLENKQTEHAAKVNNARLAELTKARALAITGFAPAAVPSKRSKRGEHSDSASTDSQGSTAGNPSLEILGNAAADMQSKRELGSQASLSSEDDSETTTADKS